MKNKTPFQCGQEDAFFNLAKRPRYVLEGKVYKLVQSQEELVAQYYAGRKDADQFYDGTEKRIKRTTVLFAEDTGEVKRMTDEVVCSGQVSSKKGD
jgi:hypothetical protein|tara:strand:- start:519 stop:806 length:288 start_codon:yes stop_codon:yes gene_type:complete